MAIAGLETDRRAVFAGDGVRSAGGVLPAVCRLSWVQPPPGRLNATFGHWTGDQVYIYLGEKCDAHRANHILVRLGAAIDKPFRLPNPWLLILIVAVLIVLAVLSAEP